jgi:hypothetical protein
MRTATTIGKTAKGWVLLSGPDTPADKQRMAFGNIGANWPKDVSEVRYQSNDGAAKVKLKDKATNIAQKIKDAIAIANESAKPKQAPAK